ncbi:MAG: ATP-binding protein [Clostridia bacterium]|nr:ATP-binding protein [Clostridia bacterium]
MMEVYYLLNLRISGIKSIETPIEIPFYKKTIKNDFDPEQYRVKGIYGENGSGKTAIMLAVRIMTRILLDRNYLSDSVNQRLLLESINKKTRRLSVDATYYTFDYTGPFICHYQMVLEIGNDGRVCLAGEKLERKIGHNSQMPYVLVFETRDGSLFKFNKGELFKYCKEKTKNLLGQRSFATFINEIEMAGYSLQSLPGRHLFSLAVFASRIYVEIDEADDHREDAYQKLKKLNSDEILREQEELTIYSWASAVKHRTMETVITRNQLPFFLEQIDRLSAFVRIFKPNLKNIDLETKEYGEFLICRRVMEYEGFRLDEEYESRGIKKLMRLFDILDAASKGNIVFIDELDSNINDIYLDKLIEYFTYYGKGQLCFTAHNLSPMSVLRNSKCAISFISGVNTVHTWTSKGNQNPEHAYRDGFIEDSPFNVDASDFLGVLGGADEDE